jgi:hypothetical protein
MDQHQQLVAAYKGTVLECNYANGRRGGRVTNV